MITEDMDHAMFNSLSVIVGKARMEHISGSDLHKLVSLCESNRVNPGTHQGGLFAFYLMVFDKELGCNRNAIPVLAKQFADATLGLTSGLNVQLSKVIEDVILDTVEWGKLDPTEAAIILADVEKVKFITTMLRSGIHAIKIADGKEEE